MNYSYAFRTYFSFQHLKSAALFCKQSYEIEKEYAENFSEIESGKKSELISESYAFVTGTIFTCVSFLEANINEFYKDAADRSYNNRLFPLSEETIVALGKLWNDIENKFERSETKCKYQIALKTAGKSELNKGQEPYQSVKLLISLRNALIHYKTETLKSSSFDPDNKDYFEKSLAGRFNQNLLHKYLGNPYFPDKCLGYGCAKWAIISAINFADEFYKRIGVKPSYDHIKEHLNIGSLMELNYKSLEESYRRVNQLQKKTKFNNGIKEVITAVPEVSIKFININDKKEFIPDTGE